MPSIPEEPEQGELERLSMPDFLRPLQDLEVGLAKEAMLECQVTGLPYPTISWFHNGHRIQSSDDRRMTQCMCLGRDPGECPLWHSLHTQYLHLLPALEPSLSSLPRDGALRGGECTGARRSWPPSLSCTAPPAGSPLCAWGGPLTLAGQALQLAADQLHDCGQGYGTSLCLSFLIYKSLL